MLVFDTPRPAEEALRYSVELAHRMSSTLVLLKLVAEKRAAELPPGGPAATGSEDPFESCLEGCAERARAAQVRVERKLRVGDPASQLMKFLAEAPPVQTIVWGGDGDVVRRSSSQARTHWLARVRHGFQVPVVVPVQKR